LERNAGDPTVARPLLSVEGLVKRYGKTTALAGLDLRVWPGEIVGLVGPNGAGKTTALRCISGVIRPTVGRVLVGEYDVVRHDLESKQLIALVPEIPNPYELLTVWEHLQLVARAYGREDVLRRDGYRVLERLSLVDRRNDLVLSLSKGMKQKLTVACAFIHEAKLFLLDEPLMGLDPRSQRELLAMVREATESGAAALVSTHILDTAERICHRIVVLQGGRVTAEGTVAELRESAEVEGGSLEDVFLVLTENGEATE
jgi:ABC-2 type transport system ATP-binding protein